MLDILAVDDVETLAPKRAYETQIISFCFIAFIVNKNFSSLSASWLSLSFDVEGMTVLKWGSRGTNYSKPQVARYFRNFLSLLNIAMGWY